MLEQYENYLLSFDQTQIAYRYWQNSDSPDNQIIITHGLGEHGECYEDLTNYLVQKLKLRVISWDLRGHGLSGGRRGFVNNFSDFTRDLKKLVAELTKLELITTPEPFFLGHSLGGLITTRALIEGKIKAKAVALSSPAFGLALRPPKYKVLLAKLGSKSFPALTMNNELKYSELTHDESVIESYERDSLRHSKISPRLFTGMLDGFDYVLEKAPGIKTPLFLQIPGKDKIISAKSSIEFSNKLDKNICKLIQYEKSYHEIYNDFEKESAKEDLVKFLGEHL